jgi:hypothetical protein
MRHWPPSRRGWRGPQGSLTRFGDATSIVADRPVLIANAFTQLGPLPDDGGQLACGTAGHIPAPAFAWCCGQGLGQPMGWGLPRADNWGCAQMQSGGQQSA